MYLGEVEIRNIKCFEHVHLQFPHQGEDYSGWNVLLGVNASGKSTLLQTIAVTLVGHVLGQRLIPHLDDWVRFDERFGSLRARIWQGPQDKSTWEPPKVPHAYSAEFAVTGYDDVEIEDSTYQVPQLVPMNRKEQKRLAVGLYAPRQAGWLHCGYGPFRRFAGNQDDQSLLFLYSSPEQGCHPFATLFFEGIALSDGLHWLGYIYNLSNDPKRTDRKKRKQDLELLLEVVNSLLPARVQIEDVDSYKVYFRTVGGLRQDASNLSDGYRCFLAMAVDLLRKIYYSLGGLENVVKKTSQGIQIDAEGVVLIDEVDAHLHPGWQQQIGFRLRKAFPKIQFIVNSHSPFVAQAASPGGLFLLRVSEDRRGVVIEQPVDSIAGWRVDQILTSPLFGLMGTRDEETERLLREHADLIGKRNGGELNAEKRGRLADLEARLSERLTFPGETVEERERQANMARYVEETLQKVGGHS